MQQLEQPRIFTSGQLVDQDDDCACPDKAFVLTFEHNYIEADSDCACPDGAFGLQHKQPIAPLFTRTPATHTTPLPHNFHLALSPYAPGGPSILNPQAWERWQCFTTPQHISQPVDHELAQQLLIQPHSLGPKAERSNPETLTAWLHITNACNLDCPYCYVRKSSARMNKAIGLQAVEKVFRAAQQQGFRRVKLKYAGGEATLHFKLVRMLHERAVQLTAETGIGLKEVVLSNGVHLREADALWLRDNGVKLMISLDGIGESHNQLRPLRNRPHTDTFSQIAHTIDNVLHPLGIKPDITMTVTAVNAHAAPDVAQWAMIDRDLPLSFNFYRQNILSASRTDLALEEQTLIDGMLAAYDVIEKDLPEQPFLNGLLDRVQAEAHTHTCGVGQSYVVVTHTGQLAQCQMHLDNPVSPGLNGEMIPLVANGPLRNLSVDDKEGCRTCEFRYRCSGGCPLETYRATGRWDVQSPNCHIYKTLYPAALRLEGLRLMKVHGYLH
jgi:uncharacterized protein